MVHPSGNSRIAALPALIIGLKFRAGCGPAIVQYLWVFVEFMSDAMAAEFPYYRITIVFCMFLDGRANIAEIAARLDLIDADPHALKGDLAQATGLNRSLADCKHAAGISV